jgi:Zn-dependent protease with chaperone function
MFVLREIAVSLTFFVLFYGLLSALVTVAWRAPRWLCGWLRASEQTLAAWLFRLRILPLTASVLLTLAFVVPSFQLLEPRSIDEGMGVMPLTLGICALLLIACGGCRVITAQIRTSRVVARWLEGAHRLELDAGAPSGTLRSGSETPPLTLVGVRRPRVLVSESAVALLNRDELHIALQHELAHMQSLDNLKKLVFRFCAFPGMAKLERAWSEAAERAADDAAVTKLDDALDLAAALVKVSRLVPVEVAPICTVGFGTGSIGERVARLVAWEESSKTPPTRIRAWHLVPPVAAVLLAVVLNYGSVLAFTHEATEWLVR